MKNVLDSPSQAVNFFLLGSSKFTKYYLLPSSFKKKHDKYISMLQGERWPFQSHKVDIFICAFTTIEQHRPKISLHMKYFARLNSATVMSHGTALQQGGKKPSDCINFDAVSYCISFAH